jgi:hypothetical protein
MSKIREVAYDAVAYDAVAYARWPMLVGLCSLAYRLRPAASSGCSGIR